MLKDRAFFVVLNNYAALSSPCNCIIMFVMVSFPYILSFSDNSFRGDTSTELAALLIQSGMSKIALVAIICMVFFKYDCYAQPFCANANVFSFSNSARLTLLKNFLGKPDNLVFFLILKAVLFLLSKLINFFTVFSQLPFS